MDKRILDLALEALQARHAEIELEIEALTQIMNGSPAPKIQAAAAPKRFRRSAAQRKAHSEKMKLIWQQRKAAAGQPQSAEKKPATPKTGPQTAAARKAQSDRMKAYWAKRKAEGAKKTKKK